MISVLKQEVQSVTYRKSRSCETSSGDGNVTVWRHRLLCIGERAAGGSRVWAATSVWERRQAESRLPESVLRPVQVGGSWRGLDLFQSISRVFGWVPGDFELWLARPAESSRALVSDALKVFLTAGCGLYAPQRPGPGLPHEASGEER